MQNSHHARTGGNGTKELVLKYVDTSQKLCNYSHLGNTRYHCINPLYFVGGYGWIVLSDVDKCMKVDNH